MAAVSVSQYCRLAYGFFGKLGQDCGIEAVDSFVFKWLVA